MRLRKEAEAKVIKMIGVLGVSSGIKFVVYKIKVIVPFKLKANDVRRITRIGGMKM